MKCSQFILVLIALSALISSTNSLGRKVKTTNLNRPHKAVCNVVSEPGLSLEQKQALAGWPSADHSADFALLASLAGNGQLPMPKKHNATIPDNHDIWDTECFVGYVIYQSSAQHFNRIPVDTSVSPNVARANCYANYIESIKPNTTDCWDHIVDVRKAQAGDVLAWSLNPSNNPGDNGHVMIVINGVNGKAVQPVPNDTTGTQFFINVADSSDVKHYNDGGARHHHHERKQSHNGGARQLALTPGQRRNNVPNGQPILAVLPQRQNANVRKQAHNNNHHHHEHARVGTGKILITVDSITGAATKFQMGRRDATCEMPSCLQTLSLGRANNNPCAINIVTPNICTTKPF